ncbi:MAG TPA: hypothetical protein VKU19_25120 [Bryobacteraceae bacterium]|nr:hypothetical protein [Bryobacteraceae bacterium]
MPNRAITVDTKQKRVLGFAERRAEPLRQRAQEEIVAARAAQQINLERSAKRLAAAPISLVEFSLRVPLLRHGRTARESTVGQDELTRDDLIAQAQRL